MDPLGPPPDPAGGSPEAEESQQRRAAARLLLELQFERLAPGERTLTVGYLVDMAFPNLELAKLWYALKGGLLVGDADAVVLEVQNLGHVPPKLTDP